MPEVSDAVQPHGKNRTLSFPCATRLWTILDPARVLRVEKKKSCRVLDNQRWRNIHPVFDPLVTTKRCLYMLKESTGVPYTVQDPFFEYYGRQMKYDCGQ